ncbi:hypothetical protein [Neolewinella persica]|uniref:hypothetical protein n=1 Tax=Neolewinella persica TaxID=70998 RepID=UPI0003818921|nr:hypothetical protein [Neolewinella persica]
MNKSTKHTDALLRQRLLKELPKDSPSEAGWAALSAQMDADADLGLQAALQGLSAAPTALGWQALERKLDPINQADSDLAGKLNGLQPTVTIAGWAALEARLEKENDQAVDAIVADGLARTGVGVTSGWAALAARLELIGWRRGFVSAWKITEASLLLSMLLLVVRFGPLAEGPVLPIAKAENGFPVPMEVAEAVATIQDEAPLVADINNTRFSAQRPVANSAKKNQIRKDFPLVLPTALVDIGYEKTVARKERRDLLNNEVALVRVPSLEIKQLRKTVYLPSPVLNLPEVESSEPVQYYVNAFVSPLDINQVVTPRTSIGEFDISGDRRFTYGSSVGLLFDFIQGKNGLQVGAIYSRRSYIPTALKWYLQDEYTAFEPIKGYQRFNFENITFDFNYKRTLLTSENWRVSGRMGVSLSVIARSSFDGKDEVVAGFNEFEERVGNLPDGQRSSGRPTDFSGQRKLQNPPNGWLEGGSILANSSFYLGGGIVVERLMNPRWSIYVSPAIGRVVYLKVDQGIGPYNDRIHLSNLRFGSRYLFGGK